MPLAKRRLVSHFKNVGNPTGMLDALEPLTVRDITSDGMRIESPNPLEVGSIHEFRLSDGTTGLRIRGAVRHVSPPRMFSAECYFLVDLEFLKLSTRSSAVLERWLNEQSAQSTRKGT